MVTLGPVTPRMALAVDLDHQPCGRAVEVDDVATNRVLAPELETIRPLPKHLPQHTFRESHLAPQSAGAQNNCVLLSGRWQITPPPSCGWFPSPCKKHGEEYYWLSSLGASADGALQLHGLRFVGGGAVATNSASLSQPLRPPASLNLSIPLAAYSWNERPPL